MDSIEPNQGCRHVESSQSVSQLPPLTLPKIRYSGSPCNTTYTPSQYLLRVVHLLRSKAMSVRGRKAANGTSPPEVVSSSQADGGPDAGSSISGLLTTTPTGVERDEVKVNNASVTDMKHACDDALKRVSVVFIIPARPLQHVLSDYSGRCARRCVRAE